MKVLTKIIGFLCNQPLPTFHVSVVLHSTILQSLPDNSINSSKQITHLTGSKNKNKTLFINSTIFIIKKIWATELNNNPTEEYLVSKSTHSNASSKGNFSPYNFPFFLKTPHSPLHMQT